MSILNTHKSCFSLEKSHIFYQRRKRGINSPKFGSSLGWNNQSFLRCWTNDWMYIPEHLLKHAEPNAKKQPAIYQTLFYALILVMCYAFCCYHAVKRFCTARCSANIQSKKAFSCEWHLPRDILWFDEFHVAVKMFDKTITVSQHCSKRIAFCGTFEGSLCRQTQVQLVIVRSTRNYSLTATHFFMCSFASNLSRLAAIFSFSACRYIFVSKNEVTTSTLNTCDAASSKQRYFDNWNTYTCVLTGWSWHSIDSSYIIYVKKHFHC